MTRRTGADLCCDALAQLGASTVFGLPGTQNVGLFEALRRSGLRTVVPTHELAAAFAAGAWGRVTGAPGVAVVIPGPGFAYALPALAEASHDSVPMVLVVGGVPPEEGSPLRLQYLDHEAIAAPLVRGIVRARTADEVAGAVADAWRLARADEPGPVLLALEPAALDGEAGAVSVPRSDGPGIGAEEVAAVAARLAVAERPLLFVGQGVGPGAPGLRALAERLGAPVVTTLSGRGALPDDHPLAVGVDLGGPGVAHVNRLAAEADLILALGAKFAHNGTGGFRLRFPADRLVRVDASRHLLTLGPEASLAIGGDVPSLVGALLAHPALAAPRAAWRAPGAPAEHFDDEPAIAGASVRTPAELFALLRDLLPREAVVVTDSGRHQVLVRRHLPVLTPRGLLAPSDFQSMGFGLPAALGAALACPEERVVAVVGDGGLLMSGLELATLASLRLPVTVLALCDDAFGLIRDQQLREHGAAHGTDLPAFDPAALAGACGAGHVLLEGNARAVLQAALSAPGPVLVEVRLGETAARRRAAVLGAARGAARRALPSGVLARLRRLLGRG